MSRFFAIEGLEIQLADGVMEITVTGERLPESHNQSAKLVALMMREETVEGVLRDIRDASFPLTDTELELRAAPLARTIGARPVACVSRPDQEKEYEIFRAACAAHGAEVRAFRFIGDARDWLDLMKGGDLGGGAAALG